MRDEARRSQISEQGVVVVISVVGKAARGGAGPGSLDRRMAGSRFTGLELLNLLLEGVGRLHVGGDGGEQEAGNGEAEHFSGCS